MITLMPFEFFFISSNSSLGVISGAVCVYQQQRCKHQTQCTSLEQIAGIITETKLIHQFCTTCRRGAYYICLTSNSNWLAVRGTLLVNTTGLYRPIFRPSNQKESIATDVKITKPRYHSNAISIFRSSQRWEAAEQSGETEEQRCGDWLSGDSPTGSSAGSGCYCPHQVQW